MPRTTKLLPLSFAEFLRIKPSVP